MKTTITISKNELNGINLPGMGRSIELNGLSRDEMTGLRYAFSQKSLQVEFEEEKGIYHDVTNIWPDPHSPDRITVFIA